jgi:Domain of unknown function (DUF4397)
LRRVVPSLVLSSLLVLSAGCGSGSGNTAQLRFVQGSQDAPVVDFVVDGKTQATNLSFGNATAYISLSSGSRHVQVIPENATSPVLDERISLADSDYKTLFLTGPVAQSKSLVLTDGGTISTTGDGYVRVLDISTTMGPADIYIVAAGSSIAGVTPNATGITFDQDAGYQGIPAGDYQVIVTVPGTTNAYLTTGPLSVASLQYQTVIVRDSGEGGFTFSLLQDQ